MRWQAQDADGALLRDQLRQSARLWEERGRGDDLLWTGEAYVDFLAWRGRYPGRLSSLEEDFAAAMTGLANRRRRRRRLAVATLGAVMAVALAVLATFWSRSESARRKADAEALRAEASKVLALGQAEEERYPSAALAYAIKSLELADTREARRFALRLLQAAPTALFFPMDFDGGVAFSPDGQRVSLFGAQTLRLLAPDGRETTSVATGFPTTGWIGVGAEFGGGGEVLVGGGIGDLRAWSVPDGRELRRWALRAGDDQWTYVRGDDFVVLTTAGDRELIERGSIRDGAVHFVGSMEALPGKGAAAPVKAVDAAGERLAYGIERNVYVRSLRRLERAAPAARHPCRGADGRRLPSRRPPPGGQRPIGRGAHLVDGRSCGTRARSPVQGQ